MAYVYILLSAICSLVIAHLLKVTEVHQLRTLHTLTVNYIIASLIAFGIAGFTETGFSLNMDVNLFLFSLIAGSLFISNFLLYSKSVHANGVGVTITAMRVSLVIPVLISILGYHEHITWLTTAGIIMVIGGLILLVPRKHNIRIGNLHAGWILLFIFITAGCADTSLKIYKEEFGLQFSELQFMGLVFVAASLIGVIVIMIRQSTMFTRRELGMGCLIAVPNLYSSIFLIYALGDIDGAIAFPLVNALNVAGGTTLGLWLWNDKVTGWQWAGIGLATMAIFLLV